MVRAAHDPPGQAYLGDTPEYTSNQCGSELTWFTVRILGVDRIGIFVGIVVEGDDDFHLGRDEAATNRGQNSSCDKHAR